MSVEVVLIVFGPLPPPRHGASTVNEAIGKVCRELGIPVLEIDTAPPSLLKSVGTRLHRFMRVASGLKRLAVSASRKQVVYLSLSGGYGLLYEAMAILLARISGAKVVVHHHSFRYLDSTFWAMQLLTLVAGRTTLHISLGRKMEELLKARYTSVKNTLIISNAAIVDDSSVEPSLQMRSPRTVGFLSNLSPQKGLHDFLALAEAGQILELPWRFVMAGPLENPTVQEAIEEKLRTLRNLEYRGALYARAKHSFFEEIDVFVFPTRYRNEAEPLVLLEAMSYGRPVIAFGRGCIPELLDHEGGLVIPLNSDFVGPALDQLESWRVEGKGFDRRRIAARTQFVNRKGRSQDALFLLCEQFKTSSR